MRSVRTLFLIAACLCFVAVLASCAGKATSTPAPTPSPTAEPPAAKYYVVSSGDTLWVIAERFGVTMDALAQANKLDNPDSLSIGQRLVVPSRDAESTATPAPIPTPKK